MKLLGHHIQPWFCAAGLVLGSAAWGAQPAQAPSAAPHRQFWRLSLYTWVKLVPREAGAPANDQPVALEAGTLAAQLGSLAMPGPAGEEPLFTRDEAVKLSTPLGQAFAAAGPDEDVLLVSTNRRGGESLMKLPRAVTMRLFWRENALQVIVHDTRFQFLDRDEQPVFTFGSRTVPGAAQVHAAGAANLRADWLALQRPMPVPMPMPAAPVTVQAPATTVAVQAPATPVAVQAPATPVAVQAPAAPVAAQAPATPATAQAPAASPAPPHPVRDAAFFEQQEQRLRALKHLRDEGLVSEEEFRKKRQAILDEL